MALYNILVTKNEKVWSCTVTHAVRLLACIFDAVRGVPVEIRKS